MTERKTNNSAADNFVKRFGKDAPTEARKRAAELQDTGNVRGRAIWMLIYQEVTALVDGRTNETKH